MTTIHLVGGVSLASVERGEVTQLGLSHIALRQGTLDGACGPYALMMALIVSGGLDFEDAVKLWSRRPHGNSMLAREQSRYGAFVQAGTSSDDLQQLFRAIGRNSPGKLNGWHLDLLEKDDEVLGGVVLLRAICDHIDTTGMPLLLGLEWMARDGGGAHWVVVVGYEGNESEISHLVLLDPSADTTATSLWNAVLTGPVQRGARAYLCWNDRQDPRQCGISIALGLRKNSK